LLAEKPYVYMIVCVGCPNYLWNIRNNIFQ